MSVGIIGDANRAALYCDTTDVAFGPVFESTDHAEDFLAWLGRVGRADETGEALPGKLAWLVGIDADPRKLRPSDLDAAYLAWRDQRTDDEGALLA